MRNTDGNSYAPNGDRHLFGSSWAKADDDRGTGCLNRARPGLWGERRATAAPTRKQFAYVASHDMQEPLRTVASFVDLLAERYRGKLDEKADKYISFAVQGVHRMSILIDDLLAYSRVGRREEEFVRVDMAAALAKAGENLKKAIEESGAAISSDRLPSVSGDESQIVQLLQNLVANAIKFRKKDVQLRIHVSAERRNGERVFCVRDNGIGIEPRFHERVFTIFQRLHTREEYPGTGVGLAICRKIVERHGGRIRVESKPGDGPRSIFP